MGKAGELIHRFVLRFFNKKKWLKGVGKERPHGYSAFPFENNWRQKLILKAASAGTDDDLHFIFYWQLLLWRLHGVRTFWIFKNEVFGESLALFLNYSEWTQRSFHFFSKSIIFLKNTRHEPQKISTDERAATTGDDESFCTGAPQAGSRHCR